MSRTIKPQGRIYRPQRLVKDASGQPVRDAAGHPVYQFTSPYYYAEYYDIHGVQRDRSTKTTKEREAQAWLAKVIGAKADGRPVKEPSTLTFEDGVEMLVADYAAKHQRLDNLPGRFSHLRPVFGDCYLAQITATMIRQYRADRLKEEAADATINAELSALRRMYGLARENDIAIERPFFLMVDPQNARQGFFEEDQAEAIMGHLPADIRGIVILARTTGWRVQSEVLLLPWAYVERRAQTITLPAHTTKTKKVRTLFYGAFADIAQMIERQWASAQAVARREGRVVAHVFHLTATVERGSYAGTPGFRYGGNPVMRRGPYKARHAGDAMNSQDFYTAWRVAAIAAGYPNRNPHDFRRTAARDLLRAGNHEKVCMSITGHKTPSQFKRYDIVTAEDQNEAARKLAEYRATQPRGPRVGQVRRFNRKGGQ